MFDVHDITEAAIDTLTDTAIQPQCLSARPVSTSSVLMKEVDQNQLTPGGLHGTHVID